MPNGARNRYQGREESLQRRMQGDNALCSFAALIGTEWLAKYADYLAMKRRSGFTSSNLKRPTFQSSGSRTSQRIDRNPRVCARFAMTRGPGELSLCSDLRRSANSSPGAIYLGPPIIAEDSPGIQHVKRRVTERGEYFAGDDRAVYRPLLASERASSITGSEYAPCRLYLYLLKTTVEQRFGVLEVCGVEALGERSIDRREQIAKGDRITARMEQSRALSPTAVRRPSRSSFVPARWRAQQRFTDSSQLVTPVAGRQDQFGSVAR
jgi:hypothetical protein